MLTFKVVEDEKNVFSDSSSKPVSNPFPSCPRCVTYLDCWHLKQSCS